ncbi:hypothetical protein [Neolewinella litorea]|uniref:Uncharacterized protein n=1 Tax=Neolewinella litorea TaxID=2562452 RepID=A0A4S4NM75_9BACT|nr:hypothetical protein [Neolewinella litorea]THH41019.1 hypothetical protein E4021_00025 [Neolewinella litorea]
MNIFYLGTPDPDFVSGTWAKPPRPLESQPLYEVDALFVFAGADLSLEEQQICQLVERSGRPVVRVGAVKVPLHRGAISNILMIREYAVADQLSFRAWLDSRPRTNYQSIDCSFYDRIEAAIVAGLPIEITFRQGDGEVTSLNCSLKDRKTINKEEYVQLEGGEWIRLDHLVSLGGTLVANGCTV